MPYGRFRQRRKYRPTRRRGRTTRVGAPLGRAPRWRRGTRVAQNLTRNVFWFKVVDSINSSSTVPGTLWYEARPQNVFESDSWNNIAGLFKQFKCLSMMTKIYPANVGAETIGIAGGPGTQLQDRFYRGDCVSWADLDGNASFPPTSIAAKMGNPSARLFNPRAYHKRWLNRPRGYPEWDGIGLPPVVGGQPPIEPSTNYWNPSIQVFGQNFSSPVAGLPHFYVLRLYKVMFRSRRQV